MSAPVKIRFAWRARLAAVAGILTLVAGPAVVTTAEHAAAAPAKNWAGPGCPQNQGWTCTGNNTNGVTQTTSGTGGVNHANCVSGSSCDVTQVASAGAKNEAVCNKSRTTSGLDECTFHQTNNSGSNTVSVNITANLTAQSSSVNQNSDLRMTVSQVNQSGPNSTTGALTINQAAVGSTSGAIQHIQEARQLVELSQTDNSGPNNATLTLKDNMSSSVKGKAPHQEQNTGSGFEPISDCDSSGSANPDGLIHLVQENGSGSNSAKIRGTAKLAQAATSISNGATQLQGHSDGGWLACLKINPSGNVDLGSPGTNDGLVKNLAQHATLQGGGPLDHSQIDPIRIPLIGQSPANVTSNSLNISAGDPGVFQQCTEEATGHADANWSGQLKCNLGDGATTQSRTVEFSGQTIDATLMCEQNTGSEAGFADFPSDGGCTSSNGPPSG